MINPIVTMVPEELSWRGNETTYDVAANTWDFATFGATDFSGDWKPDSTAWEDGNQESENNNVTEPYTPEAWHKAAVGAVVLAFIAVLAGVIN